MTKAASFFVSIHLADKSDDPSIEHGILRGGRHVMAVPSVGDVLWFGSAREKVTYWRVLGCLWGMTPNCDPTAIPVSVYVKATGRDFR